MGLSRAGESENQGKTHITIRNTEKDHGSVPSDKHNQVMALQRRLSILEFTALGILFKRAPCTAYAVLSEFSHSATSAYRSGAGSVYPMLRRLEDAGLVASVARSERDRLLSLTPVGFEALRSWFDLTSEGGVSCCLDVLRSRVYFLRALSPQERATFLHEAIVGLERLLDSGRDTVKAYRNAGDRFSEVAMLGAVMETEARLRWLEIVLAHDDPLERDLPSLLGES
jgi:DNA-binding PadR family transcriptional regulator